MSALAAPDAPKKRKRERKPRGNKPPRKLALGGPAAPGAPKKRKHQPKPSGNKPPRKLALGGPKRFRFLPYVVTRQPSLQDEEGNSIKGTETYGTEPYCPVNKKNFFSGQLVDDIQHKRQVPSEKIAMRVNAATLEGGNPVAAAQWLIVYLMQKKNQLLSSGPGTKVGLGEYKLDSRYVYIIEGLVGLLNEYILTSMAEAATEKGENHAERINRAAIASAKRRTKNRDEGKNLIF